MNMRPMEWVWMATALALVCVLVLRKQTGAAGKSGYWADVQ